MAGWNALFFTKETLVELASSGLLLQLQRMRSKNFRVELTSTHVVLFYVAMESKSVPVLPNNQAPVQFLTEAGESACSKCCRQLVLAGYKLNMSEMAIASAAFYYHKFKSTMSLQCYDIHVRTDCAMVAATS